MRRLLNDADLPAPDEVEYRETEIVLLWNGTRTAVVIDLTDGPDGGPGDPLEAGD